MEELSYTNLGEVKTKTDVTGIIHKYQRDAVGRLTSDKITSFGPGASLIDQTVSELRYGYDSLDRPTSFTSHSSNASTINGVGREYDGFGRLAKESQDHHGPVFSGSPNVAYGYDGAGRQTTLMYPNGRTVSYDYSNTLDAALGRPTQLNSDPNSEVLESYQYLGTNALVARSRPLGGTDRLDWSLLDTNGNLVGLDAFGRVTLNRWNLHSMGVDADQEHVSYGYDRAGNKLFAQNHLFAGTATVPRPERAVPPPTTRVATPLTATWATSGSSIAAPWLARRPRVSPRPRSLPSMLRAMHLLSRRPRQP